MTIKTYPRGAAVALATVTRPSPKIYLLSMHNTSNGLMDNRLTPAFITDSLLPALDEIEHDFWKDWHAGNKEAALVITGEREKHKFFSNGLDLTLAAKCPHFFRDVYYKLLRKVVTFPMHTVCAINGHNFAGGFALATACDWRLVRSERAWSCMNELDFGVAVPVGMQGLLSKTLSPSAFRSCLLEAHRFTAAEALEAAIVDEIVPGDGEAVIKRALEFAGTKTKHSVSGALPQMKQVLYKDVLKSLQTDDVFGSSPAELNEKRFKQLQAAAISAKL